MAGWQFAARDTLRCCATTGQWPEARSSGAAAGMEGERWSLHDEHRSFTTRRSKIDRGRAHQQNSLLSRDGVVHVYRTSRWKLWTNFFSPAKGRLLYNIWGAVCGFSCLNLFISLAAWYFQKKCHYQLVKMALRHIADDDEFSLSERQEDCLKMVRKHTASTRRDGDDPILLTRAVHCSLSAHARGVAYSSQSSDPILTRRARAIHLSRHRSRTCSAGASPSASFSSTSRSWSRSSSPCASRRARAPIVPSNAREAASVHLDHNGALILMTRMHARARLRACARSRAAFAHAPVDRRAKQGTCRSRSLAT